MQRTLPPMLDPDTFSLDRDNTRWRSHTTERLGQFDIAVPVDDDLAPHPAALPHLEAALARIDMLYDIALPAAEQGWQARYNAPLRNRSAWSLIRLLANPDGSLVLSLNEGEYDTYCLWDVTLVDDQPTNVMQRTWGG